MCKQKLLKDPNIIDQTKHFTETLISIGNETIAKTAASTNTALLGLTMTAEQLSAYVSPIILKNTTKIQNTIFNDIWINSNYPQSWKIATIIPMPKSGRDGSNSAYYRPIALTSCLCKTIEYMTNKILVWLLNSNKLITNSQKWIQKAEIDNLSCG